MVTTIVYTHWENHLLLHENVLLEIGKNYPVSNLIFSDGKPLNYFYP